MQHFHDVVGFPTAELICAVYTYVNPLFNTGQSSVDQYSQRCLDKKNSPVNAYDV